MGQNNFLDKQLTFLRVQKAKEQSDIYWQHLLEDKLLHFPSKQIYLRAFKQEQVLEVWASDDVQFQLIKTYNFTATSGKLGPKQKEGDKQIPEGLLA